MESTRNCWVTLKDVHNLKARLEGRGNDAIRTDILVLALKEEKYDPIICYKRNSFWKSHTTAIFLMPSHLAAGIVDETGFEFDRFEFFLVIQTKFMADVFTR